MNINANNKIICRLCKEGFILLSNNHTCLNISKNHDLVKFKKCDELTLDNNNNILRCSRCKNEYLTLLKTKDEYNCLIIYSVNNNLKDFSTSYDEALSTYFENNQDMITYIITIIAIIIMIYLNVLNLVKKMLI